MVFSIKIEFSAMCNWYHFPELSLGDNSLFKGLVFLLHFSASWLHQALTHTEKYVIFNDYKGKINGKNAETIILLF